MPHSNLNLKNIFYFASIIQYKIYMYIVHIQQSRFYFKTITHIQYYILPGVIFQISIFLSMENICQNDKYFIYALFISSLTYLYPCNTLFYRKAAASMYQYTLSYYTRTTEVYIKLNSEKNYSIQNRIPHLKLDLIIPERLQIYRLKRYVNK